MKTAVEILVQDLEKLGVHLFDEVQEAIEQAKEMEKKETLKRQLFIGKVSEIIGFEKTLELWQETLNEIK